MVFLVPMKRLFDTLLILFLLVFSLIFRENSLLLENIPLNGLVSVYYDINGTPYIYIDSYTRKDGTFIKGYYRSLPDKNKLNNWSTKGNINPFSGKKGYENP